MQIYLARPGGQKEGPFTLEQVQRDLAARKYRDSEFWAFHDGLPNWIPLHSLPGLHDNSARTTPAVTAPAKKEPAPVAQQPVAPIQPEPEPELVVQPIAPTADVVSVTEPIEPSNPLTDIQPDQEVEEQPAGEASFPYSALEQIFIFTSGEPRPVFQSQLLISTLQDLTGESLKTIQHEVATHVIGRADVGIIALRDKAIPAKAWRAIAAIEPAIAGEAKDGGLLLAFRVVQLENQDVVALLCFYNKNKLVLATA